MFFTGNDILDYLSEILYDLQHIGNADIVSLIFRVVLVVVVFTSLFYLAKNIFLMLKNAFSPVIFWLWGIVTAPYRIPKKWARNWFDKRQRKKDQLRWQREKEDRQRLEQRAQAEKEQQELETFKKLMED